MYLPSRSGGLRFLGVFCLLASLITSTLASPVVTQRSSSVTPSSPKPRKKCYDRHRNFRTVSSIYNLTVYPNQLPIIGLGGLGVPPGLFHPNVTGRVDPVGSFEGFEHSIEYFFALAPMPFGNPAKAAITSYKIVEFSSGCPEVAASVVYLYCNVVDPGTPHHGKALAPLRQVAFWKFDDEGAVINQSIQSICAVTQATCRGANQQWSSIEECISVLSQKDYGRYQNAWGDNIVCRTIHIVLTQLRPEVHCPHVGPTGGGKCIQHEYPDNYFNDVELYDEPVGDTFMCDY
ncbi:unnamed protein product [Parascedosporium putredinis]|uniref:Uncharacterized protein n=1 Tax=Parascedosporium putredinis TaxID=1442378 RepID=A0A9P1H1W2_9PEZI|nr:unnamed protein product [Parascedosporium putredinis]CAI7994037.1 unnamed protein product [Parascedosporium putredinis]